MQRRLKFAAFGMALLFATSLTSCSSQAYGHARKKKGKKCGCPSWGAVDQKAPVQQIDWAEVQAVADLSV